MKDKIVGLLEKTCKNIGILADGVSVEYPDNPAHGDYSCNIALVQSKKLGQKPREVAEKIVTEIRTMMPKWLATVEIAGPGFINFKIADRAIAELVTNVAQGASMRGTEQQGKTIMVEFTDANPFKVIHIGHLMSNAIGESISRLADYAGATVKRASWQGDVGLHVAKTIWGVQHGGMNEFAAMATVSLAERVTYLGKAYAAGTVAYDEVEHKKVIDALNKTIFERSDPQVNEIYDIGRIWSLDYFETIYARLGTKFDYYFFEGKEGILGKAIVEEFLAKGVFEQSEGAVVFKGEPYGLHTRVFINSMGLPTYEAKELGLNREKFRVLPELDQSLIVTGNEITDYFKVLLRVMELIYPEIAARTRHIPHGMLRLTSGKMSSRTGKVVAAEDLIDEVRVLVREKIAGREFSPAEAEQISDTVAVGAIKYSILRASIGGDIVYDRESSISFEGDSGPYLQYAAVRAASILTKAKEAGIPALTSTQGSTKGSLAVPEKVGQIDRLICRFPEIAARAWQECAPQHVAGYLTTLASAFNSFYASQTIVNAADPLSPYYVALTDTFRKVLVDGLWILGIRVPEKM